ncbi:hypothetical protein LMH87_010982 [Akanthomyces muscarius]|uniref:Uncharacterized protein n=1 Tax=Akanthomyces muscarius TaxID=2231603 RepID=A0A9W8QBJ7_AKAMU|nr:hypothetical protein LMH87_010982 [Akanthomyces muscarius]KAJ4150223.1 hypothetical protein LMH87_010982 [Akanthomyces muscarius]
MRRERLSLGQRCRPAQDLVIGALVKPALRSTKREATSCKCVTDAYRGNTRNAVWKGKLVLCHDAVSPTSESSMAESEKTPQGPESEKRQLGIEAEQQQQAYQNRTPDLETTEWMAAQLAEIEVISAGGKLHEALQLLDAGLAKLQGRHDVRLWESMLLTLPCHISRAAGPDLLLSKHCDNMTGLQRLKCFCK